MVASGGHAKVEPKTEPKVEPKVEPAMAMAELPKIPLAKSEPKGAKRRRKPTTRKPRPVKVASANDNVIPLPANR
jgi:hypothetical protein